MGEAMQIRHSRNDEAALPGHEMGVQDGGA
jgi:hypothetical protein